ncbi:MAG: hypothetical protein U0X87_12060 [Anaerolineales bacterium]
MMQSFMWNNWSPTYKKLTPFHVRQIHKLVLSQIDDASAGNYRATQVHIAGARTFLLKHGKFPSR